MTETTIETIVQQLDRIREMLSQMREEYSPVLQDVREITLRGRVERRPIRGVHHDDFILHEIGRVEADQHAFEARVATLERIHREGAEHAATTGSRPCSDEARGSERSAQSSTAPTGPGPDAAHTGCWTKSDA